MRTNKRVCGAVAATLLAMSACTTDPASPAGDPETADRTEATSSAAPPDPDQQIAEDWWLEMELIGQPAVAAGTAVVLESVRGKELDIVGVEVTTGEEAWRLPWGPGAAWFGDQERLTPTIAHDADGAAYAVFARPKRQLNEESSAFAPIVVVELATGEVVGRTGPVRLEQMLVECSGGFDACAMATRRGEDESAPLRIGLPDAAVTRALPEGARYWQTATGLYFVGDLEQRRFGRMVAGERVWEVPWEQVFPLPDFFRPLDDFALDETGEVLLGSFQRTEMVDGIARISNSGALGRDRVLIALDAGTGEVQWRKEPAPTDCLEELMSHSAWCRITGHQEFTDDFRLHYRDLAGALQGFDPTTGEVTWRVKVRRAEVKRWLGRIDRAPAIANRVSVVVTPDGPVEIDPGDGSTRQVAADEAFLCWSTGYRSVPYVIPAPVNPGSTFDGSTRFAGKLPHGCRADGKRYDGPLSRRAIENGAVPAGDGWYVVALDGQLRGYHLD